MLSFAFLNFVISNRHWIVWTDVTRWTRTCWLKPWYDDPASCHHPIPPATNIQSVVFPDSASQVIFLDSTSEVALYRTPIVLLCIVNDKYFRSMRKAYALRLVFLFISISATNTPTTRFTHKGIVLFPNSVRTWTFIEPLIRIQTLRKNKTRALCEAHKGFRRRPVGRIKRGFGRRNPFKWRTYPRRQAVQRAVAFRVIHSPGVDIKQHSFHT